MPIPAPLIPIPEKRSTILLDDIVIDDTNKDLGEDEKSDKDAVSDLNNAEDTENN